MTYKKQMVALAGAAGLLLGASTALAQAATVACSDTSVLPNPIFMAGSSAFEPILSPPDAGVDAPAPDAPIATSDAASGEAGTVIDICTNLTAAQCHLAIINAPVDSTVSAIDPGADPPVLYPACSAQ